MISSSVGSKEPVHDNPPLSSSSVTPKKYLWKKKQLRDRKDEKRVSDYSLSVNRCQPIPTCVLPPAHLLGFHLLPQPKPSFHLSWIFVHLFHLQSILVSGLSRPINKVGDKGQFPRLIGSSLPGADRNMPQATIFVPPAPKHIWGWPRPLIPPATGNITCQLSIINLIKIYKTKEWIS